MMSVAAAIHAYTSGVHKDGRMTGGSVRGASSRIHDSDCKSGRESSRHVRCTETVILTR